MRFPRKLSRLFRALVSSVLLTTGLRSHAMLDENADGVSDIWAAKFELGSVQPGQDSDGDGIPDRDEAIAGTNPFSPASTIRISAITSESDGVHLTFPSLRGKRYQIKSSASLTSPDWQPASGATPLDGTDADITVTLPIPASAPLFFEVTVQDLDSDQDGLLDWEEIATGFDPHNANTMASGQGDKEELKAKLAAQNTVAITAAVPIASEGNPPVPGKFLITRQGNLNAVTVSFAASGSAVAGVDYVAPVSSVTLPFGVNSALVMILPLNNPSVQSGMLVTETLIDGGSAYALASPRVASVTIMDSTTPSGTGLKGEYFDNGNSNYAATTPANFTSLRMTRTDATVDFLWGTGAPDASAPLTPPMGATTYSARWTGQVQPEFSEVYTFVVKTDDGVKLWVNGQLLVDRWTSTGESAGSISLQAGVRYDIRMEYYQGNSNAEAHLSWFSDNQIKQIIPQARLYPSAVGNLAPPAITSGTVATALVGGAFSYQITASNVPTSFTATNLPAGFAFNASTGVISATTVPNAPGVSSVPLSATNAQGTGWAALQLTVTNAGGAITREIWTGVSGTQVSEIPLGSPPSATSTLSALEAPQDFADDFGERWRGFLTAPTTGAYQFWLTGDSSAELLISEDADEFKKLRRTDLRLPVAYQNWAAGGKTPQLWLEGGKRYYLEARHKAGSGSDHFSIAWKKPGDAVVAPPSVVPGYVLSPYTPPATQAFDGTLFTTNLIPQTGTVTHASGSATLRLNAAETQATLTFNYAGLTTDKTGEHIHSGKNAGAIIFDIDDTPPNPDGSYTWTLAAAGAISVQDIRDIIKGGDAYLNIHTSRYPAGEIKGFFKQQSATQIFSAPPDPVPPSDDHTDPKAAARFLQQATFGPSPAGIAEVMQLGYDAWIETEFAKPISTHLPTVLAGGGASPTNYWPGTLEFNTWWQQSITAPDQLRQRVAFALSEIMVVSDSGVLNNRARTLAAYYDTLLAGAFGNYRDLLKAVTLTPAMGVYLDMRQNDKPLPATGQHPNENYAREIKQLFSIGLNRLHPDGTLQLDASGNLMPTYTQDDIQGLAHVFTGWNYHQPMQGNGQFPTNFTPGSDEIFPMREVPSHHFTGPKRLLSRTYLPGIATAAGAALDPYAVHTSAQIADAAYQALPAQELDAVHDLLAAHPNTGPFICRQLIQRLVTSTPSRGYISRVAQKFDDDGSPAHVRGNLRAVIKAILLDYEARSPVISVREAFGKQREPVLRVTGLARAFPAPPAVAGTFSQSGSLVTVTASGTGITTNALSFLDFTGGASGSPGDQGYRLTAVSGSNPPQFTTRVVSAISGAYTQAAGSNVATVDFGATQHGLTSGARVYLDGVATTGSALTGNFLVTVLSATQISVLAPDTTARTGTSWLTREPQWPIGGTYAQPANSPTVTVDFLTTPHGLAEGTRVYLDFTSGTAPDGFYTIAVDAQLPTKFTVQAATSTLARSGNVTSTSPLTETGTGTYAQAAGTNFMTLNFAPYQHGLSDGHTVALHFTSGAGVDGDYVVNVLSSTQFTVPAADTTAKSGSVVCTRGRLAFEGTRTGTVMVQLQSFQVNGTDTDLAQTPLAAPTVFNFFEPDYIFPGTLALAGLTVPEFKLASETNVIRLAQYLYNGVRNTNNGNSATSSDFRGISGLTSFNAGGGALTLDLRPWMGSRPAPGSGLWTSNANVPDLIEEIGKLLIAGQLAGTPATVDPVPPATVPALTRTLIKNYVLALPFNATPTPAQIRDRVRAIVQLLATAPEFAIQK